MVREVEFRTADTISSFLNLIAYLITPILFIWAVNTLFDCGIATTFKTWLAGLILTMLIRFHLRGTSDSYDEYYDDEDYYDEEADDDYEDSKEQKARLKAKLMACQNHKNKKDSPPDES